MGLCREFSEGQLKQIQPERLEYLGKTGDVFVSHGQLLHGGSGIRDLTQTRKTLVTH